VDIEGNIHNSISDIFYQGHFNISLKEPNKTTKIPTTVTVSGIEPLHYENEVANNELHG
jgi:hypothetical protein